jgi:hypothetical protein
MVAATAMASSVGSAMTHSMKAPMGSEVPSVVYMPVIVEITAIVVIGSVIGVIIGLIIIAVIIGADIRPSAAGEQGKKKRRSTQERQSVHECSFVHIPQSARRGKCMILMKPCRPSR